MKSRITSAGEYVEKLAEEYVDKYFDPGTASRRYAKNSFMDGYTASELENKKLIDHAIDSVCGKKAEIERLRAALQTIADLDPFESKIEEKCFRIAFRALNSSAYGVNE